MPMTPRGTGVVAKIMAMVGRLDEIGNPAGAVAKRRWDQTLCYDRQSPFIC